MTRSKTWRLLLGSAFVLALAGLAPAVYGHGGDSTLIHACVNKSSGEVKIVGANASCKTNETAVDWPGTSAATGKGSIMVQSNRGGPIPGTVGISFFIQPSGAFEYRLPRDGTIQNMRILIEANSFNGPTVVTLFVNGNPSLSTTIPAGSTADVDVPGTVGVLDGDRVSLVADAPTVSSGQIGLTVSYEIQ